MKTRSAFGLADLLFGVASVLLGIYVLFNTVSAIRTIVFVIGGIALIGGVSNIFFGFHMQQNYRLGRTVSITAGVLNIIIALLILFNVGVGAYLLSIFLPIWFIAHCVSRLANLGAFRVYGRKSLYWSALILNLLGIAFGILLMLNPAMLILSIEFLTGSYLVLTGISSIIAAFSGLRTKIKEYPQRDRSEESEDKEMSKSLNKLKAQKAFDKTGEQKQRNDYERDVPQSSFDQMP